MNILLVFATIALIAGIFILLKINVIGFLHGLFSLFARKKKSMRQRVLEYDSKKKPNFFKAAVIEAKEVLVITGKENSFNRICAVSVGGVFAGLTLGIMINNIFLSPVLAVGFSLLPFWYVRVMATFYKKHVNEELETALSMINNSYFRSEDIILAIEENVQHLRPPVGDVFKAFLAQSKLINSNTALALESIKPKINNAIFREWIDALCACIDDRTLKSTLTPIVSKLSDMRIVSGELDYLLYAPLKEVVTMAILVVGNLPLMYFLNREWFHLLVGTGGGKMILAVSVAVILMAFHAVMKLTKPVEYER